MQVYPYLVPNHVDSVQPTVVQVHLTGEIPRIEKLPGVTHTPYGGSSPANSGRLQLKVIKESGNSVLRAE